MSLIDSVKKNEGFKSTPYIDPLVNKYPERYGIPANEHAIIKKHLDNLKLTFGYGFTFITEEEAEAVLELRLKKITEELKKRLSIFENLPFDIQQILIEMAYQMGVNGVLKFRKMLAAIEKQDWCEAYKEGKNSRWFRQTPSRALRVLKSLKERCGELGN